MSAIIFDLVSFIVPAIIGGIFGAVKEGGERTIRAMKAGAEAAKGVSETRDAAAKRGNVKDVPRITNAWEGIYIILVGSVRPIITYIVFFSFFILPFLSALLGLDVNMELCQPRTGFWAWVLGQEEAICKYVTLGPAITWTQAHTTVLLMIGGFWFGERMVK